MKIDAQKLIDSGNSELVDMEAMHLGTLSFPSGAMDILSTDRIDPVGLNDRVDITTVGTPTADVCDIIQPVGPADLEADYTPSMKHIAAKRRCIADLLNTAPEEAWRQVDAGAPMPILDPAARFELCAD